VVIPLLMRYMQLKSSVQSLISVYDSDTISGRGNDFSRHRRVHIFPVALRESYAVRTGVVAAEDMDVWSFPSVLPHILMAWYSSTANGQSCFCLRCPKPESFLNVVNNKVLV
jgi:hypothetical protein